MYINFRQLAASDMTPNDLANLLAIRQKDSVMIEAMPEEDAGRYIDNQKQVFYGRFCT